MKITIEIDDERLKEEVYRAVLEEAVADVRKSWGQGYIFRNDTKAVMREVIRENMDSFAERAIAAAAKSIENRAIKQRLNDFFREDNDEN